MKRELITNCQLKTFLWCLYLFFIPLSFISCVNDDDENNAESELFEYLQGTWETIHIIEKEEFYPVGGEEPYFSNLDMDITQEISEYYALFVFDRNSMCTMTWYDSEENKTKLTSARFKLDGNKLSCPIFYGDFTDYVTVKIISEDVMTIELIDNGTDDNGVTNFSQIITLKRKNKDHSTFDLTAFLQGTWVTTHINESRKFYPSNGDEPLLSSTDEDILSNSNENYKRISFNKNSICTLLESGSPKDNMKGLPISEKFTLFGSILSCPLFYGNFTTFVIIQKKTEDEMTMTLIDNGTDENGRMLYNATTTYKRFYE